SDIYHLAWDVFFFQAEDGIRDYKVTGVQTCALPILFSGIDCHAVDAGHARMKLECRRQPLCQIVINPEFVLEVGEMLHLGQEEEIGRASCRERVETSEGA